MMVGVGALGQSPGYTARAERDVGCTFLGVTAVGLAVVGLALGLLLTRFVPTDDFPDR